MVSRNLILYRRIRVKPSKAASLMGMVVGLVFVALGAALIIPVFGIFGIFWTLVAAAIAAYSAYNFFSKRGVATYEMDLAPGDAPEDFEAKLRKLAKLKEDGLINEEEYERKRAEIVRERW